MRIYYGAIKFVIYILAKKTWVGYFDVPSKNNYPQILKGVISPITMNKSVQLDIPTMNRLNFLYAKNYSIWMDLDLIGRNISKLGD